MPLAAKRPCGKTGCPKLVSDTRYCPDHTDVAKQADRWRGTAASRGYDSDHRKLRDKVFRQSKYLCQPCLRRERVTPATDLHHLKKITTHPHLRLDEDNVVACCRECHEDLEKESQ
jgi:5-methylcytosine-specific restriction protein A